MIKRGLLTLVCVVPLVAFGGAYRWLTLPLFLLTAVTFVVCLREIIRAGDDQRALDVTLLAACAAIAAQLLPLPQSVLDVISPEATRVRNMLRLGSAGSGDGLRPLSIDPEATLHALGIAATAVLTFLAARGVFSKGGVRRWCQTMAWVGLAASLAAVIQRATTPDLIYGVWRPLDPNGRPFGPFVNRNHFAAWLLMAGFLAGGYAIRHASVHLGSGPHHLRRVLRVVASAGTHVYVSAALVMLVTAVLTLSRSAIAGLVFGTFGAGLLLRRRFQASAPRQFAVATALVLAGVVLVSSFVDSDRVAARLDETVTPQAHSRSVIWRESVPLLGDFWLAGAGAGAYGSAMLLYEDANAPLHFNQAHSHYLQVATEGGLLLVLPWLLAGVLFTRYAVRLLRADDGNLFFIRLGALCGIAAIAVQSIWETPLRMSANAVLFAVLCGIALHQREDR